MSALVRDLPYSDEPINECDRRRARNISALAERLERAVAERAAQSPVRR